MDINDFRTFLEVCRTRHFGQAAKNLCVTQSTVSARIRNMEEQLGTKLFSRERNNIQLTTTGERMRQYAEVITTSWNQARQEIGAAKASRTAFCIGGLPSLWDISLQHWLNRLIPTHQDLAIHAEIHGVETLYRRIVQDTMDIAFLFDHINNDQLVCQTILDIELILVSSRPGLNAAEALTNHYIMVDWGTAFNNQHAQHFADIARPHLHVSHGRIALDYILANGGNAYLAKPMAAEHINQGELYTIANAPVIQRPAYAIYNKASDKLELIESLLMDRFIRHN
jgi:DNA-binding transcriptional LysR family regulator